MSDGAPIMVAFGGGLNSTAMVLGMAERGGRPDAILFADTGGEKPETYRHVEAFSAWCERHGLPAITTVRANRADPTLEAECLNNGRLPSLAYGWKKCSQAWKRTPQDVWTNAWTPARAAWSRGEKVVKAIGFEFGEERRVSRTEDEKYQFWYPLIEWRMDRDACDAIARRHGFVVPKSSCFYCPASKLADIRRLRDEHPGLLRRALAIEDAAMPNLSMIEGLGRRFSWRKLIESDAAQGELFREPPEMACGCYDGDEESDPMTPTRAPEGGQACQ